MSKQLTFYAPFHRVQVVVNGVPLSLNAEVEVTIKRPAKLDGHSARAWEQAAQAVAEEATLERVPGGKSQ